MTPGLVEVVTVAHADDTDSDDASIAILKSVQIKAYLFIKKGMLTFIQCTIIFCCPKIRSLNSW